MNKITEALELLDDGKKWTGGRFYRDGKRCMVGALVGAAKHDPLIWDRVEYTPEITALAKVIREQFPIYRGEGYEGTNAYLVTCMNDDAYTDGRFSDVRMVMEKAAIAFDEQASFSTDCTMERGNE